MKMKRIVSSVTAAMLLLASMVSAAPTSAVAAGEMRDITTMELVRDMGIGINLGNTFEACPDWYGEDWIAKWSDGKPQNYETAWGSPVVTKEMIEGMAKEGFGVLRIPVAWSNMMEHDGTYTINPEYDARVHEVVDWTLESGMYCIINIHWDGGWVNKFPDDKDESMKRYAHMWEQIAESFKDYSDCLMFESQNEELGWESVWNPWGSTDGKAESYALVNEINQKFVDIVRASGGNNAKRHLLISGYNTGFDRTCDPLFKMPTDPANRMAVSVHYYTPAGFCILEDKDESWAKARSTWGTDDDYNELNGWMDMMKTNYVDKGIPVIIGEYGCPTKGKEADSVRRFISSVCKAAYERQLCPILWSTPDSTTDDGTVIKGHYDRKACQLADRELQKELYEIGGKEFTPQQTTTATTTETTTTTTTTTIVTTTAPETVMGDVNGDGSFEVSDLVTLGKWLLADRETALAEWKNADFDGDGRVDTFDLCLMRKSLLQEK